MVSWTDETETQVPIEDLKSAMSLSTVAEILGYDVMSDGKILSPFHEERTPSCQLYDNDGHFWDFSCGKGGDIIDLVMAAEGCTWIAAVRQLRRWMGQGDFEPGEVRQRQEKIEVVFDEAPSRSFIRGDAGAMTYYHRNARGDCVGIKYRSFTGHKTSEPGSTFPLLWDPEARRWGYRSRAVVCEGESDAIALNGKTDQVADIYALPSGAGSWKPAFEKQLERYGDYVWVCMDNDRAGLVGRDKIHRLTHYRYRDLIVPHLFKDAREAIEAGWVPTLR